MRKLVVLSGSGISADSGLDTFRTSGDRSLWAQYDADQVCNFDCWEEYFDLVHEFYSRRREQLAEVAPNPAHFLAVSWQKRFAADLITQNVDDLFERAGAQDVLHVHGRLTSMCCFECGAQWDIGYSKFDPARDRCPQCQGVHGVKPNVVFFREPAPLYGEMWRRLAALTRDDVLVVIGTSGAVLPIAEIARRCPATSILSNLESEPGLNEQPFDHVLHGRAAEIAPQLDALATRLMERPGLKATI
ncbi:Sir2 family NAD-dependent protein deacetylase [uncultured Rhodoblastus sp.]|uniref:SIR2 family NAD-dependent protein deacylase n=1 Tax=uncultured Rhodoblastus sp. TaxID=543037 RepID=UPI0025EF3FE6|nr:Sir2 family NAD-dependent protein deacetylase [uncultured Rhodoblastus sp.]